jgi:hypothetical protein
VGFWVVLVFPSPKLQFQLVGVLAELSVKVTVNGAVPIVGVPVKLAMGVGMAFTRIKSNRVVAFDPPVFVEFNDTV